MSDELHALREECERLRGQLRALGDSSNRNHFDLVEAIPYGVLVHQGGVARYLNAAAASMLKLDSPEAAIGTNVMRFVHPDYRETVKARIASVSEGDRATPLEEVFLTDDGEPLWVEVTGAYATWEGEAAIQVIFLDISERKEAEAERLRHAEDLRHAHRMESVGRLAGGVAHDFNNVLTGILGYLELIELSRGDDEALMADIRQIRRAADRAADMTRHLAAFGRKRPRRNEVIDVAVLLSDLNKILERVLLNHKLILEPDVDTWNVRIDPLQFEQLVMNLAFNARDAMQRGCLTIRSSNHSDDANDWVRIDFEDDGPGIDDAVLERVFEPFFSTRSSGTGLGLTTVREIVEINDGRVEIARLNSGTQISVFLPRTDDPVDVQSDINRMRFGGSESILIVDDDPIVRRVALAVLARSGYSAESASDLASAQKQLLSSTFDLVLSDVLLPDGDARNMKRLLGKLHPTTRLTFTSGYVDEHLQARGLADIDYLPKPFVSQNLLSWVRDVLDD